MRVGANRTVDYAELNFGSSCVRIGFDRLIESTHADGRMNTISIVTFVSNII